MWPAGLRKDHHRRTRLTRRNADRRKDEFHISNQDLERALSFWQPPTQAELDLFDPMP